MAIGYKPNDIASASDFLLNELLKKIRVYGIHNECEFDAKAMLQQWMKMHRTIKPKDAASFIRDVLKFFQTELLARGLGSIKTVGHKATWEKPPPRQPLRSIIYCEGNPCHHCHNHWPGNSSWGRSPCDGCPHSPSQRLFDDLDD